jgi:citrate lyase subunit beta/citryl-CoA lyase
MNNAHTYLFVPGNRPERIVKAIQAGADVVIVDLEDAVAPDDKTAARHALHDGWARFESIARDKGVTLLLRINAAESAWHEDDLHICRTCRIGHIVVPKAAQVALLAQVAAAVPAALLYPLIESAEGFDPLHEVAQAPAVARLLFGSIDLMLDLGIRDADTPLHFFRTRMVLQSRLAGLPAPVDGVCVDVDNAQIIGAEVKRARDFGFGGKMLIHPRQLESVRQGFLPSAEERDWARRIVAAAADGAAVSVDGKMVDRPVLKQAERILENAR